MTVTLKGNSPATLTAGILLLSRARSFGHRLDVAVMGDPHDISPVHGPALVHSPVLASCGVGRELGAGALVIVSGPSTEPLATSISADGTGDWFEVDRAGEGHHDATRAFVRLCRDRRLPVRDLARSLRRAITLLGCAPEPAVLDLLFAAPAPPLMRVALALRAGRAMTGTLPDASITRFFSGDARTLPDPLPASCSYSELLAAEQDGRLAALFDRLSIAVRDDVDGWVTGTMSLGGEYAPLVCALVETASHLATLPPHGMLAPLDSAMDSVAVGLGAALGAVRGDTDANAVLADTFRFLGGRFTDEEHHPVVLDLGPAPQDRLERWRWLCIATRRAADTADALWRKVIDPLQ